MKKLYLNGENLKVEQKSKSITIIGRPKDQGVKVLK
jgi:hypothetical protein